MVVAKQAVRVSTLYALIVTDGNGDEAVMGAVDPDGRILPAMSENLQTIEDFLPWAQKMAQYTGRGFELCKFQRVE